MFKIESGDDETAEVSVRHTFSDEFAVIELTQDSLDYDGADIDLDESELETITNVINLTYKQARAIHEALGYLIKHTEVAERKAKGALWHEIVTEFAKLVK